MFAFCLLVCHSHAWFHENNYKLKVKCLFLLNKKRSVSVDVAGQTVSSVAEEKLYNKRLTKTKEEFIKIMQTLNLPYPKQIGEQRQ